MFYEFQWIILESGLRTKPVCFITLIVCWTQKHVLLIIFWAFMHLRCQAVVGLERSLRCLCATGS